MPCWGWRNRMTSPAPTRTTVGDQLGDVLDIFLEHAGLMPFGQFQQLVRRWESIADADGAHRSHEASHRQRRASMYFHEFTAELHASGGAVDGAEMQVIFQRYRTPEPVKLFV